MNKSVTNKHAWVFISYACLWSSLHDVSTVNHLHLNKKSKVVRQIFIENNEKLIKLIKLIRRLQRSVYKFINRYTMVVIFNYKWNSSDQRKQFPLPLAQFGLGSIFEQWEGLGRVSFECHFLLIFVCTLYIALLWVPLHLNAAIPLKLYKEKNPS